MTQCIIISNPQPPSDPPPQPPQKTNPSSSPFPTSLVVPELELSSISLSFRLYSLRNSKSSKEHSVAMGPKLAHPDIEKPIKDGNVTEGS